MTVTYGKGKTGVAAEISLIMIIANIHLSVYQKLFCKTVIYQCLTD